MDPEAFKIIDGKLYLNWSKKLADNFEKNSAENVRKANENWAKVNESN